MSTPKDFRQKTLADLALLIANRNLFRTATNFFLVPFVFLSVILLVFGIWWVGLQGVVLPMHKNQAPDLMFMLLGIITCVLPLAFYLSWFIPKCISPVKAAMEPFVKQKNKQQQESPRNPPPILTLPLSFPRPASLFVRFSAWWIRHWLKSRGLSPVPPH